MFPVLGAVAGVLAGLLGIGGGLVLVAALAWLLPMHGVPAELAMPMMGLSSSSFRYPMAPKRLLCGAFCRPFFILSDLMKPPLRQNNIAASHKGQRLVLRIYKVITEDATLQQNTAAGSRVR